MTKRVFLVFEKFEYRKQKIFYLLNRALTAQLRHSIQAIRFMKKSAKGTSRNTNDKKKSIIIKGKATYVLRPRADKKKKKTSIHEKKSIKAHNMQEETSTRTYASAGGTDGEEGE